MSKPRLAISFSGGRSSAVMLHRCLELYDKTHDILITFANTGREHEETLRFVDAVDRHFAGGKVVWIESVINGPGKGPTAREVTFETASRQGEPMEAAIKKHGVFCVTHKQCTSRLKTEPMLWWRKQQGWENGTYDTAIGIRADESDRMSEKKAERRLIYPLVKEGWTKALVNKFMSQFEWDLRLPNGDADGNCINCFKKSFRKLYTVAKRDPKRFLFNERMERKYGNVNKGKKKQAEPRVFYRGRCSTAELIVRAHTEDFEEYEDDRLDDKPFEPWWDNEEGCGGSCEAGADDE